MYFCKNIKIEEKNLFKIGTPYGYRHMNGYGSHTFKMVNAKDEPVYVKVNLFTISFDIL